MPQENKSLDGAGSSAPVDEKKPDANAAPAGNDNGGGKDDNADDDEVVTIKKSELAKKDAQIHNLTEGIKIRDQKKDPKPEPTAAGAIDVSKFVTKDEVQKKNEQEAIANITTVSDSDRGEMKEIKNDINDNWDEIVKLYVPRSGKSSAKDIEADILDAHAAYRRRNPISKSTSDARTRANIAADRGFASKGGSSDKGNASRSSTRIIPPTTNPSDWYKKKD